jgi:hypothetical protein
VVGFDRMTRLFSDTICKVITEVLNLIFIKWHYICYTITELQINFVNKISGNVALGVAMHWQNYVSMRTLRFTQEFMTICHADNEFTYQH